MGENVGFGFVHEAGKKSSDASTDDQIGRRTALKQDRSRAVWASASGPRNEAGLQEGVRCVAR
jgi:hypothetical protein